MSVTLRVSNHFHLDKRGWREIAAAAAMAQAQADEALEREWIERVRQNPKERRRLQRQTGMSWLPKVFTRQAG